MADKLLVNTCTELLVLGNKEGLGLSPLVPKESISDGTLHPSQEFEGTHSFFFAHGTPPPNSSGCTSLYDTEELSSISVQELSSTSSFFFFLFSFPCFNFLFLFSFHSPTYVCVNFV